MFINPLLGLIRHLEQLIFRGLADNRIFSLPRYKIRIYQKAPTEVIHASPSIVLD
jgi:hypothetical protein